MKKTNVTGYSFDPITNVVTCSESFLKKYADAFKSEETAENTAETKPNLKLVENN